ncbi:hypothetical protein [Paenibacillus camelliae]|uniref:hypothetical protein n=1 Tax=Paenibacillus camelliae TaxID=512410 RepID=UPI002040701F|nr:hypothetical protein [Paenibacillus camelliae]MCM3632889.1 hypothetical protein [Paenibacillus camelliae]
MDRTYALKLTEVKEMRRRRKQPRVDPYMQDVPYEIIRNDKGKVLAEVLHFRQYS